MSFLTECVRRLSGLAPNTAEGLTILQNEATAQKVLSQLRIHDQRVNDLRTAVIACCTELGQSPPAETDALDDVISTLEADVLKEEERLKSAQVSRQEALISYGDLLEIEGRLGTLVSAHEKRAKILDLVEGEFNRAEKRRLDFKHIASTARDVRTAIISRVFNDSLNALWRDLFVRLAPSQSFVPAFRIPQSDREVMAILETVHRDGGHGGAPGTMLSAGNLIRLHLRFSWRCIYQLKLNYRG